ncbi:MAG: energy transducer TonB [Gammaproteobacteria bacterium]|nr:energy transducer TonB [Gammaproteobacteria bacterium]
MSRSAAARVPASAAALFAIERPEPEVSAADRFSFALFLTAALHVAVILGIGFTLPDPPEAMRSMEVTLARFRSETPEEQADFLAQADQQGSGTLEEARERTTDRDAPADDEQVHEADTPAPPPGARQPEPAPELSREDGGEAAPQESRPSPALPDRSFDSAVALQQAMDQASLDARRSSQVQVNARGERVRRITSASTPNRGGGRLAASRWRREVETIGDMNYPAEARARNLEGDLRVLVEINSEGSLLDVRILESSGSEVLDRAALRIVRLAAPFLPFPEELRRETDVLHIVRTWQFRRRGFGAAVRTGERPGLSTLPPGPMMLPWIHGATSSCSPCPRSRAATSGRRSSTCAITTRTGPWA